MFRIARSNYGKKDKTVKVALDARKLRDSCIIKRPNKIKMDEIFNQILSELSKKNELDQIWISVIDLDYTYGRMTLAPETSKKCNFAITGEKLNGYYRFLKGFYGPADMPTIFQEKMHRTVGHQIPVWLDDIILVTRGTKEQHTQNLDTVQTKFENEGYKASKKSQNSTRKKQRGWDTPSEKTESDQTKKKQTQSTN